MTITELSSSAAPLLAKLRTAYWLTTQQYKQIEGLISQNKIEAAEEKFNEWKPE
jgi:hypothetical protein